MGGWFFWESKDQQQQFPGYFSGEAVEADLEGLRKSISNGKCRGSGDSERLDSEMQKNHIGDLGIVFAIHPARVVHTVNLILFAGWNNTKLQWTHNQKGLAAWCSAEVGWPDMRPWETDVFASEVRSPWGVRRGVKTAGLAGTKWPNDLRPHSDCFFLEILGRQILDDFGSSGSTFFNPSHLAEFVILWFGSAIPSWVRGLLGRRVLMSATWPVMIKLAGPGFTR